MNVTLISPHLVQSANDLLTTGIVYMPIGLAYASALLAQDQVSHEVIDCFGLAPNNVFSLDKFYFRGLNFSEINSKIQNKPGSGNIFILYAINIAAHDSLVHLAKMIKENYPDSILIALENSQAVTAYSLKKIQQHFHDIGFDYIATGDPEVVLSKIVKALVSENLEELKTINGRGYINKENQTLVHNEYGTSFIDLNQMPFPAWDKFPIENYWKLGYAHGPFETKKYLPLLTSRGCPYLCNFCVIPTTNGAKWRARLAQHIVDEMDVVNN